MSVEQLTLTTEIKVLDASIVLDTIRIEIAGNGLEFIYLDHNQAHLLMLYLQEHLALPAISKGLDDAITDEINQNISILKEAKKC